MAETPNSLPIGGPSQADALLQRALLHLEALQGARTPSAAYQYVDVVFAATPDTDTDVRHTLKASNPETIRFQVVEADRAVSVYRDKTGTAKAWTSTVIYLRGNVASASCRILLTVER